MILSVMPFRRAASLLVVIQIAFLAGMIMPLCAAIPQAWPETGDWKFYNNPRHGFVLRCPTDLDLVAEDHLLPDFNPQDDLGIWSYYPPRLSSELRLAFVPTIRDRISATFEIYVTAEVPKFFHLSPDIFLGLCPVHPGSAPPQPNIGGLRSTVIDVYDNDHLIHNVFVAHHNRIYLFVARDPSHEDMERFNAMLSTVRFTRQR